MKTQTLALTTLIILLLFLGVGTCSKTVRRSAYTSTMERCRVNRVILVDDYQEGRSVYPGNQKWILQTDEGYKVITRDGYYQVGDSINIEVVRIPRQKRNK